jgi:hypothetical protein
MWMVVCLFLTTLSLTKAVYGQDASTVVSQAPMYMKMSQLDIFEFKLWGIILVVFGAGSFGGIISFLMNFKVFEQDLIKNTEQELVQLPELNKDLNTEEWEKWKQRWEWAEQEKKKRNNSAIFKCCLSQALIGGAAASPVLLILRPDSAFALVAMSIIIGSAGAAFFRALQEQMLEYLTREEKVRTQAQNQNQKQSTKIGELIEVLSGNCSEESWSKAQKIANELKGLCAMGSVALGKPSSNIALESVNISSNLPLSNSGQFNHSEK